MGRNVARAEQSRNTDEILVIKLEGKSHLGRHLNEFHVGGLCW